MVNCRTPTQKSSTTTQSSGKLQIFAGLLSRNIFVFCRTVWSCNGPKFQGKFHLTQFPVIWYSTNHIPSNSTGVMWNISKQTNLKYASRTKWQWSLVKKNPHFSWLQSFRRVQHDNWSNSGKKFCLTNGSMRNFKPQDQHKFHRTSPTLSWRLPT